MKLFAAPKSRENVNEMLTEVKLGARKFPAKFNYIRIIYGARRKMFGIARRVFLIEAFMSVGMKEFCVREIPSARKEAW